MQGSYRTSIATIELYGPVIGSTLDTIRRQIQTKLQAGHYNLILNVAGVTLLDSLGLGLMIESRRRCVEGGGQLVLCESSEPVKLTLDLTETGSLLPWFNTEQEARTYLQHPPSTH